MYGGTTREDPEYPGILSVPDTVCCEVVCMGGKLGRIPRIPGYLVFQTCMGGQLGRIPSIPGYLVFQTLSVRLYVWGDNSGGPEYPGILSICMGGQVGDTRDPSIPGTVSVRGYVWGDNSGGSRGSQDT